METTVLHDGREHDLERSDYTIGRTLKKPRKPHLQKQWLIPPEANTAFVAAMEDVLEVYHRPHDARAADQRDPHFPPSKARMLCPAWP